MTKPIEGVANDEHGSSNPVTIAIVGAGLRGRTYGKYALENPDIAKVVAVAEPNKHRREVLSRTHSIPEEFQFTDFREMVARGKVADSVIIAILDNLHAAAVAGFAQQGYHILCEKPMATTITDCVKIVRDVTKVPAPKIFGIGHVLRYSPYHRAVKAVIDSGALGEIINIQHMEPVGNQHFAHSFVRGNWHREEDTSFVLMTKCCHDIDIISFYLCGLLPSKVQSFGSIGHFKKSRKPREAGSSVNCLDCPQESSCVWSAKKIYLETLGDENAIPWAELFVNADVLDIENVTDALRTTDYGRCVYECRNDVVDHQVVNVEYDGGVTASITMSAFTESICERSTRIQGTKGELVGNMVTFDVFDFLSRTTTHYAPKSEGGYHGGGDTGLMRAFVSAVSSQDQSLMGITPEEVLNSHLLVFAAEKARLEGGVVDFIEFRRTFGEGRKV